MQWMYLEDVSTIARIALWMGANRIKNIYLVPAEYLWETESPRLMRSA